MTFVSSLLRTAAAGVLLTAAFAVQAGVVLNGTRFIFSGGDREMTVRLTNENSYPVLIQSWAGSIDKDESPDASTAPFVITPPISRVEAGKGQALRVLYTQAPLPQDKESAFMLNVLEIPPDAVANAGESMLKIAVRTRVKLFYRPASLPGSPATAPDQLTWRVASKSGRWVLNVTNPSAYHVSFSKIVLDASDHRYVIDGGMVAPGSTTEFPLQGMSQLPSSGTVEFASINDFGATSERKQPLKM
ncbi:fimbrial biogenesis chaperone [Burkholderia cenocepacia]|uniref:fimbrial biogenesis chaperone n=1 Tax=Burkholderia cenocepacia TaxID=95486 RepID=UPI002861E605|nr:fimbria/pilus periplasmic chaperone [Burkholderia cenocepacia]MDR8050292.1 fimbria/pilus periplasmic chaperone [Burkholderia cenocepacia]